MKDGKKYVFHHSALNWVSKTPRIPIRTARDDESDAEAEELIKRALEPDCESDCDSLPRLETIKDHEGHYDGFVISTAPMTKEEAEDKVRSIFEWVENVEESERILVAQQKMLREAGVPIPPHCTHSFWGLRSPEGRALMDFVASRMASPEL
jgi:hypothetical protein